MLKSPIFPWQKITRIILKFLIISRIFMGATRRGTNHVQPHATRGKSDLIRVLEYQTRSCYGMHYQLSYCVNIYK